MGRAGRISLWGICAGVSACNGADATDTTATTTASSATTSGDTGDTVDASTGTDPAPTSAADTTAAPTSEPPTTTGPTDLDPTDATTTTPPTTGSTDTTDTTTGGSNGSCVDGEKNQDETAVDCGGGCDPCPDGAACYLDADCEAAACDDLVCGKKIFGTWGLGLIGNKTAYNAFLPAVHGHHFRFSWADWETGADVFDDAYLLDNITIAVDDGLAVGFMMNVAPTTNGNTPDWLFQAPYSVPLVTTSTMQTFPYYFHPAYQQRYAHMHDALRVTVADWDPGVRAGILFWQSAEGSTGDEGPYKGDPNNPMYAIDDDEWNAFKRDDVWSPLYTEIAADLPDVHFMVNQGNSGENFDWALDNLPGAWLKAGQFTHYYNFAGEGAYAERLQALRDDPPGDHRVRGENEGTIDTPWWKVSPLQNLFALAGSCLHAGVDILNISPTNAQSDHSVYEFFNRYAGIRRAEDGNVGFAALRDVIDLADTTRFPEADFLPLVAPADKQLYDNRVAMIMNSADPPALKESRLTSLLLSGKMGQPFLNAARITKIRAAFPDAGYTSITDNDVDSYNMDFGVDMIPGNYALFVTQQDPNGTSVGAYRQGPTDQMFGRFGRRFAAADGKDRLTFAVDPGLLGDHTYRVRVTVTALDEGDGEWSLRYWNGASEQTAKTIKNGGTGEPLAHVFDIDDLAAGAHLPNAGDLALHHEDGPDTTFFLVEVERHARLD